MGVVRLLRLFSLVFFAMDLVIHAAAFGLGVKRADIKMPWEREPLNPVFAKKPRLIQPPVFVPAVPPDDAEISIPVAEAQGVLRWSKTTSLIPWPIAQDRALARALESWRIIVMDNLSGSVVGRQIEEALEGDCDAKTIERSVSDALNNKSVATLRARASSILSFARWKKGLVPDAKIFPITEHEAYMYVTELREHNAPRTRATRFLEAVSFAFHMLGADVGDTIRSPRVRGASTVPLVIPKKKIPLTVSQVCFLEQLAVDGPGQESIFAGYLCMVLHMRLRWSDGQYCQHEPVTDLHNGKGFLECQLYHHKNAGRQKHAKRLLPAACNLPGLTGFDWASSWLQLRSEQGLVAGPGVPTMPAPLAAGGWALVPLEPSQATTWLREVLNNFEPVPSLTDIGTHSLKATWLSMMAKAGCEGDLRRLAGYHTDPGSKMALEYSRDAQAPVLLAIEAITAAIHHGLFNPDVSRAKRWPREGCNSLQSVMVWLARSNAEDFWYQHENSSFGNEQCEPESLEGFELLRQPSEPYSPSVASNDFFEVESMSSVSDASNRPEIGKGYATSDEERDAEVAAPIVGEGLAQSLEHSISAVVFRHVQSGCCHVARNSACDPDDGEPIILKCGKIATRNFEQIQAAGNFFPYKCTRCFAGS